MQNEPLRSPEKPIDNDKEQRADYRKMKTGDGENMQTAAVPEKIPCPVIHLGLISYQ